MKTILSLAVTLLLSFSNAQATELASVIDAFAIKSTADHTNNSWEDMQTIKKVNWLWPYYESGAHDSTMQGQTKIGQDKNPNIGATNITISGARSFVTDIHINIENEMVDLSVFGQGKAERFQTSCDEDSASFSIKFYKFTKPRHKPLYINHQSSWGNSGGSSDFMISYTLEDILQIYEEPCVAR